MSVNKSTGDIGPEKSYTITQAAELCGVTRPTVYKWLAIGFPDEAVIPVEGWFRLPKGKKRAGQIRILESVVKQLQQGA